MKSSTTEDETILAVPVAYRVVWWAGFPVVGSVAGWLLYRGVLWVTSISWLPNPGWLELVTSIPPQFAATGSVAIGTVAGLVIAWLAEQDNLTIAVGNDHVSLSRGLDRREQGISRNSVTAVFLDGKQLVLLGLLTEELARETSDIQGSQLMDAFRAHGYPWFTGGDPFDSVYRRWVEDLPDLTPSANALLKARARAMRKGDHDDAAELRTEIAKLGIVVRDRNKRQIYRTRSQARKEPD